MDEWQVLSSLYALVHVDTDPRTPCPLHVDKDPHTLCLALFVFAHPDKDPHTLCHALYFLVHLDKDPHTLCPALLVCAHLDKDPHTPCPADGEWQVPPHLKETRLYLSPEAKARFWP